MPARLNSILKLEVPLIVIIASRDMPVKEVMNLAPGAILELPKLADEELEILVNNKPIGMGTAVKVGENFGIRVTYVGDLRNRIEALGTASAEQSSIANSIDAPVEAAAAS
jgi:flagellar motor switch protein FliN/FliY